MVEGRHPLPASPSESGSDRVARSLNGRLPSSKSTRVWRARPSTRSISVGGLLGLRIGVSISRSWDSLSEGGGTAMDPLPANSSGDGRESVYSPADEEARRLPDTIPALWPHRGERAGGSSGYSRSTRRLGADVLRTAAPSPSRSGRPRKRSNGTSPSTQRSNSMNDHQMQAWIEDETPEDFLVAANGATTRFGRNLSA